MKLIIDHREEKVLNLVKEVNPDIEVAQLPLGDLLVLGEGWVVAIERKTARDFVASMRSNRLWEQLLRFMTTDKILGYEVKRRVLLVHGGFEGYLEPLEVEGFEGSSLRFWSSIMGALLEVIFVYNTPVVVAENDDALYAFIRVLVNREKKGMNEGLPEARWYRKPSKLDLPSKDRKRFILDGLPMVGEALAKSLLDHFGSVAGVANATIRELERVPGIGEKKAQAIYEALH